MIVPGSANALLLASLAGYQVPYSLRFRASNSANLRKTFSSASTNFDVQTISLWFKRGRLTLTDSPIANCLITQFGSGGNYPTFELGFEPSSDQLVFMNRSASTSYNHRLVTTAQYRDPSAWYHLVIAYDSSLATSTDRIKMWINGVQITSFSTATYPAQNLDSQLANNTYSQPADIGSFANGSRYFDGYMAEVNFIDGQALTPNSFGHTDATTGVWVPKKYSGTYGSNGFYLKFADATTTTTIGNDSSGNANNWTTSGISVTSGTTFDQMTDTPTLNYATFNQIDQVNGTNTLTASLDITTSSSVTSAALGTFWRSSGKWYWEFSVNGVAGICQIGIAKTPIGTIVNNGPYQSANVYTYISNGAKGNNNTSSAYGASYTTNDVIGVALDLDAGTLVFYKNNVSQGTAFSSLSGEFSLIVGDSGNASTISGSLNCGQRAFSYTPPTGFKALNTANLPTPSIKKGSLYMNATLRTGTGATASVSSLGFQPDLVWIKSRSAATDHGIYDAVRGVQKQLESNTTTAETTETTGLTAFNSNGYTVGALAQLNTNAATYVDWAWKEGATPGFDIVTYVGNGTNRTISHNLGAVPHFMIVKNRTTSPRAWTVYHRNANASPASGALYLNLTDAFAVDATNWNNTAPTSSVFSVGTADRVNQNTDNLVAYLWSEIEGFSKFGSYTGNASTDGPFVWCGFRPRWIMIKDATTANIGWRIYDTVRETYNVMGGGLEAAFADAENFATSVRAIDVLSNGFKIRVSASGLNGSGVVFIFAAFAENPFKYARAR